MYYSYFLLLLHAIRIKENNGKEKEKPTKGLFH